MQDFVLLTEIEKPHEARAWQTIGALLHQELLPSVITSLGSEDADKGKEKGGEEKPQNETKVLASAVTLYPDISTNADDAPHCQVLHHSCLLGNVEEAANNSPPPNRKSYL